MAKEPTEDQKAMMLGQALRKVVKAAQDAEQISWNFNYPSLAMICGEFVGDLQDCGLSVPGRA
jgi:hypothetical protein